jgi:hypothetical protein
MTGCKHEFVTVGSRDQGDGDPSFPIVTCPHCMTRWIGHKEQAHAVPTDGKPLFSDAVRDALLIGQDRRALRMILEDFNLVPSVTRPNACLPMTANGLPNGGFVEAGQAVSIRARPQCAQFRGTHLLIHPDDASRFEIDDLLVGNRSQTLQSTPIPALRFACDLRGDVVMSPGERAGGALFDVDATNHRVDLTPFAWDLEMTQVAMEVIMYVQNVSAEPSQFRAWILGRVDAPRERTVPVDVLELLNEDQASS